MTSSDAGGPAARRGHGPLAGVSVLELAGLGPAPFAGMILADLGADVIQVDRPAREPGLADTPMLLRGKRSVVADLKSDAGRHLVLDLAERADLLVEGFRPGVTERLGIGPADCFARNPRLVYGRLTGWGQTGPLSRYAGHDITYIAPTGALAGIVRDEGDGRAPRPVPPSVLVGDLAGGSLHLVIGLLAALHSARATGAGQVVDAAIVDGTAYLTTFARALDAVGLWSQPPGHNVLDSGAPFFEVYECADQRHLAVGALEDHFYAELLRLLDLDLPEDDPRHPARRNDPAGWPEAKMRWARLFATRSRDEWGALLECSDACVSPVLTRQEAAAHAHAVAREAYVPVGEHLVPAPAPRFSGTPTRPGRPASTGEDTDAVLRELGYDERAIAAVKAPGPPR
ncbi:MAG: CaiB/BaiF CoA transferase family protein [Dermatophilaceae bacterium]